MSREQFFQDRRLPFVECRYSQSSIRRFKPHMHRSFSIGAVDRGRVEYRVGAEEATLAPGSLVLINPECLHSCNCLDDRGRSYFMLHLDVDWCRKVQQSLWQVDSFIPAERSRLDEPALYRHYLEVAACLMAPEMELLDKEQRLVHLCTTVFERACRAQAPRAELPANIDRLKRLLGENLREELTLESLAHRLGANPYTLLRRFKAVTGITPHAYRMNCRIDLARKYLQQGMDIAETALECGFFDQSHFHRHFKAMTTVTPQEYRVNFVQ